MKQPNIGMGDFSQLTCVRGSLLLELKGCDKSGLRIAASRLPKSALFANAY
jgi:hypothetical protein